MRNASVENHYLISLLRSPVEFDDAWLCADRFEGEHRGATRRILAAYYALMIP